MSMLDSPPGPRLTLDHNALVKLNVSHVPAAGTEVLVQGIARVVHASTSDHDADGQLEAICVVLEFDLNETEVDPIPEERRPESREGAARRLYETPRHRQTQR